MADFTYSIDQIADAVINFRTHLDQAGLESAFALLGLEPNDVLEVVGYVSTDSITKEQAMALGVAIGAKLVQEGGLQ